MDKQGGQLRQSQEADSCKNKGDNYRDVDKQNNPDKYVQIADKIRSSN
jgi:hypothetical protein